MAKITEEIYLVRGMHCAACSASVEKVTKKLEGVESAEVNLMTEKMLVRYDPALCDSEKIIAKVKKAGFEASLYTEDKKADENGSAALIKLIVSLALAILLTYVSMGHMAGIAPDILKPDLHPLIYAVCELVLALPIMIIGYRFYTTGFSALFRGNPDMNTLVALSSSASFIFSLVSLFRIPSDPDAAKTLFFESGAMVIALVSVGKYLEGRTKKKTKEAIDRLVSLAPDTAFKVEKPGDDPVEVPVASLYLDDLILIRAGDRIPCDACVFAGNGSADESMLTGESLPVDKKTGDRVVAGSILTSGAVYAKVKAIGHDTVLSSIVRFVEDAQNRKAPVSRVADRVAGVFVPAVCGIALIATAVWLICGESLAFAVRIFTSVLVIACPCAMGLATPTAIMSGTGLGAKNGILVRSGAALETLSKIDTVVFDKTGTLTEGKPAVSGVESFGGYGENRILALCASLEKLSTHPLSLAVCREAEARGLETYEVTDFENVSGEGLRGVCGGLSLKVGKREFCDAMDAPAKTEGTEIFVNIDGVCAGRVKIRDSVRPEAAEVIETLRKQGIKTVLLTGDSREAAQAVGRELGIDEIRAGVLPEGKAGVIEELRASGRSCAMVGDGINDAPALTVADAGIAVGSGTDVALTSADVILSGDSLCGVARALKLGKLTLRNIRQNLFWAFIYNTLAIPLACGALYPATGLLLSPMIGAAAMSLSSLFVVTNALRLGRKKL